MSSLPSTQSGCSSEERGFQRIRLRQDTEENWLKNDPVPASGELCYTIGGDVGSNLKVGDGTRPWSQLQYLAATGASGPPGPPGASGESVTVYGPSDAPPSPANTALRAGDIWLSNGLYASNPSFDPGIITPGAKGDAATIDSVSATALPPGSAPTVTNVGTVNNAEFVFGIPSGQPGTPVALNDLSDVTAPAPSDGQVLTWNTDHWEAADLPAQIAALASRITALEGK